MHFPLHVPYDYQRLAKGAADEDEDAENQPLLNTQGVQLSKSRTLKQEAVL